MRKGTLDLYRGNATRLAARYLDNLGENWDKDILRTYPHLIDETFKDREIRYLVHISTQYGSSAQLVLYLVKHTLTASGKTAVLVNGNKVLMTSSRYRNYLARTPKEALELARSRLRYRLTRSICDTVPIIVAYHAISPFSHKDIDSRLELFKREMHTISYGPSKEAIQRALDELSSTQVEELFNDPRKNQVRPSEDDIF